VVAKCGDTTSPDVQLAVVRALLTITTAEHFRAHGDCLVQVSGGIWRGAAVAAAQLYTAIQPPQRLACSLLSCCCGNCHRPVQGWAQRVWLLACRFMLALCRQQDPAVCSVPTTNPDQRPFAPPPLNRRHCSVKQAIRTVFNVAVGADAGDMQRTARNALLQILNTVLKHVTLYPLVRFFGWAHAHATLLQLRSYPPESPRAVKFSVCYNVQLLMSQLPLNVCSRFNGGGIHGCSPNLCNLWVNQSS
jgi:hypothetical protein